nr:hypothetical protein [Actinomyces sp.]
MTLTSLMAGGAAADFPAGPGFVAATPRDDSNDAGLAQVVADLGAVAAWVPSITQIIGAPDWQVLGLAQTTAVLT